MLGAGATGGYLGARLLAAGREVTFLTRPATADRLSLEELQIRGVDGVTHSHLLPSVVTVDELRSPYDLVVVAVRGNALPDAVKDVAAAVGPRTQVVPLLNGMAHLDTLVDAFGAGAVLGATARLAATLLPHGVIVEQAVGATLELGRPGAPGEDPAVEAVRRELSVDGIAVRVVEDIRSAMWAKWVFIAASTVLTWSGRRPGGGRRGGPGWTGPRRRRGHRALRRRRGRRPRRRPRSARARSLRPELGVRAVDDPRAVGRATGGGRGPRRARGPRPTPRARRTAARRGAGAPAARP